ncbi:MAG: hypothetical protein R2748_34445 [Bryobacterales bacterium]
MDEFYGILDEQPAWLTGLVFGPQVRVSLPELRARTPKRYPIRRYPDITHSRHAQYPVPNWDLPMPSPKAARSSTRARSTRPTSTACSMMTPSAS